LVQRSNVYLVGTALGLSGGGIDLYARKPIGWAMSLSPDSVLTDQVLCMAFEARGRPKGVMFHSDQGSHYSNRKFRQHLWRYQIEQSM